MVGSHHADRRAGWFEYGGTIGTDHRGNGYAVEAAVLLPRFMFAELRYHKCEARIFAYSEASLRLRRRLGFTEEGRLRDHVFLAGRHHDLVMMGMLADEFAALQPLIAGLPWSLRQAGGQQGITLKQRSPARLQSSGY
jgi:RimJ/RimL family protein N-acetyltransferase